MEPTKPQRGSRRKSSLAFPYKTETKRGGFIGFLEDSGTADIFLRLFSALFAEKEKPEDPIRWAVKYLREKAPERRPKLDLLLETLQQDILQTAYEIDKVKEQIQQNKADEPLPMSLSSKGQVDHQELTPGRIDEPWHLKPESPIQFPGHVDTTDDPRANPETTEFLSPGEDDEGEESEYEAVGLKSTQTSPQATDHGVDETDEEVEQKEGQSSLAKYTICDPTFFRRNIPDGFWTEDFSLVHQESEEEEEGRDLVGLNYKFRILEETSWLPERDTVALQLLREGPEAFGNQNPYASTSVTSFVPGASPRPPPPTAQEEPRAVDLSHYEWKRKSYGPIFLRESKHDKVSPKFKKGNLKQQI